MKAHIERSSPIKRTGRVMQLEGIFDVPPAEQSALSWDVELPIEQRDWNIGLIVGPSGCGKSTIARELFGEKVVGALTWPAGAAIIDCFPPQLLMDDIVKLLNSVGFSSPPAWLRPFHVLSNGEQFRVTMARVLAERDFAVIDEFTSVVDRRVAQIGSHAIAKTVRQRGRRFVAVSCHHDILDWLQPDWVYEPAGASFTWRALCTRPKIAIDIARCHHSRWKIFAPHHYLSAELNHAAACFEATLNGAPVAFDSFLPFFGKLRGAARAVRVHRLVTLPDFQGLGIGSAVNSTIASAYKALGVRIFLASSHPTLIAMGKRGGDWRMTRAPSRTSPDTGKASDMAASRATNRFSASFEYVGPAMNLHSANALLSAN